MQNKEMQMFISAAFTGLMFPVNIGNNRYVYLNNYTIMPI